MKNYIEFALDKHSLQKRKYSGDPYWWHLEEVADIVSIWYSAYPSLLELALPVAWLHDVLEDTNTTYKELKEHFGEKIADMVLVLSDLTPLSEGNRAYRKDLYLQKLANCSDPIVHNVKIADLISNTPSIVLNDVGFAKVYVREKKALLDALKLSDPILEKIARNYLDLGLTITS